MVVGDGGHLLVHGSNLKEIEVVSWWLPRHVDRRRFEA